METLPLYQKPVLPPGVVELQEPNSLPASSEFARYWTTAISTKYASVYIISKRGNLPLLPIPLLPVLLPSQCNLKQVPVTLLHFLTSRFPLSPLQRGFHPPPLL